jgi:hypothetical protein
LTVDYTYGIIKSYTFVKLFTEAARMATSKNPFPQKGEAAPKGVFKSGNSGEKPHAGLLASALSHQPQKKPSRAKRTLSR